MSGLWYSPDAADRPLAVRYPGKSWFLVAVHRIKTLQNPGVRRLANLESSGIHRGTPPYSWFWAGVASPAGANSGRIFVEKPTGRRGCHRYPGWSRIVPRRPRC